jgi:hypothetical protein
MLIRWIEINYLEQLDEIAVEYGAYSNEQLLYAGILI